MIVASLDVGSYSVRLAVAKLGKELSILHEEGKITALSKGLSKTGEIDPLQAEETILAMEELLTKARSFGAQKIKAVGTQALRVAKNSDEFVSLVKKRLGLDLEVIPPELEGALAYRGATHSLKLEGQICVIDQGGGSTEFIYGSRDEITSVVSFPFGVVNLTEEFLQKDPPTIYELESLKNYIDEHIKTALKPCDHLVGIGGSITTLCAIEYGIYPYDPSKVHGKTLELSRLSFWLDQLAVLNSEQRIATFPQIEPARSRVIISGIYIFYRACMLLGKNKLTVSDWGLKEGILLWLT
ncbi:MAG: Ppx/GppA phosphatase family protein [Aquificaceae bacterium]